MRNAQFFHDKYGADAGLYMAMVTGQIPPDEIVEVWHKCAGTDFATWAVMHGHIKEVEQAMERDQVPNQIFIKKLMMDEWNRIGVAIAEHNPGPHVGRVSSEGAVRIMDERMRQIMQEGYGDAHDDEHANGQLTAAALSYAALAVAQAEGKDYIRSKMPPIWWPPHWSPAFWKPSADPIRNLEKAGALIAAEIDRLLRLNNGKTR